MLTLFFFTPVIEHWTDTDLTWMNKGCTHLCNLVNIEILNLFSYYRNPLRISKLTRLHFTHFIQVRSMKQRGEKRLTINITIRNWLKQKHAQQVKILLCLFWFKSSLLNSLNLTYSFYYCCSFPTWISLPSDFLWDGFLDEIL